MSPKIPKPPKIEPAPPPVKMMGVEQSAADLEQRRMQGKRYSFADTILAPPHGTGKNTLA